MSSRPPRTSRLGKEEKCAYPLMKQNAILATMAKYALSFPRSAPSAEYDERDISAPTPCSREDMTSRMAKPHSASQIIRSTATYQPGCLGVIARTRGGSRTDKRRHRCKRLQRREIQHCACQADVERWRNDTVTYNSKSFWPSALRSAGIIFVLIG